MSSYLLCKGTTCRAQSRNRFASWASPRLLSSLLSFLLFLLPRCDQVTGVVPYAGISKLPDPSWSSFFSLCNGLNSATECEGISRCLSLKVNVEIRFSARAGEVARSLPQDRLYLEIDPLLRNQAAI
jgi:hypothetical protein